MMERRESSVADRTSAAGAAGWRASMVLPSLASTAGHRPSSADSQSGRAAGAWLLVQEGLAAAALMASARSVSEAKKACQEASTEAGFSAQRAWRSSTKAALPPYRKEVSVRT